MRGLRMACVGYAGEQARATLVIVITDSIRHAWTWSRGGSSEVA